MTHKIDIQTEVEGPERIKELLKTAASVTLVQEAISSAALSILLTDNTRIRQLNQSFRGIDQPTDVLSFPAGDPVPGHEDAIPYLGDIAISLPVARNQAQTSGHAIEAELQLLAVHGVLHLLGYDHVLPEDKARMWSAQEEILIHLGLIDVVATEV